MQNTSLKMFCLIISAILAGAIMFLLVFAAFTLAW